MVSLSLGTVSPPFQPVTIISYSPSYLLISLPFSWTLSPFSSRPFPSLYLPSFPATKLILPPFRYTPFPSASISPFLPVMYCKFFSLSYPNIFFLSLVPSKPFLSIHLSFLEANIYPLSLFSFFHGSGLTILLFFSHSFLHLHPISSVLFYILAVSLTPSSLPLLP